MRFLFIIYLIFLGFIQCKAQGFPISEISEEIQSHAKAVVRLETTYLKLLRYDKLQVNKKVVITIFGEEGDFYQYLPIFYKLSQKAGGYSTVFKQMDNKIVVQSLLHIGYSLLPPNFYEEVKEMFQDIVVIENEQIILRKK